MYKLTIEFYSTKQKLTLNVTWEVGIDLCLQLTPQYETFWTRGNNGCCVNHTDMYFDLYQEGAIILKKEEDAGNS